MIFILGFCLITPGLRADGQSNRGSSPKNDPWLQSFIGASPQSRFSFVYDKQPSRALLAAWTTESRSRSLDTDRTEHEVLWTDPKTHLQVRCTAITYSESPVIEWNIYFKNEGKSDTPILQEVQALDLSVPVHGNAIPTLFYSRGAGGMDTYSLRRVGLNLLEEFRMSNDGGGKTVETIPFFDIRMEGRGLIGAVGWAGQWAISFSRPTGAAIDLRAGMQNTHLSLHPGEEIRTPLILLLPWQGDNVDAHNQLRRHVLKYHAPQYAGKPVVLPLSHGGGAG